MTELRLCLKIWDANPEAVADLDWVIHGLTRVVYHLVRFRSGYVKGSEAEYTEQVRGGLRSRSVVGRRSWGSSW